MAHAKAREIARHYSSFFGEFSLDVFIDGSKGAYHFAEDVVLGVVEMIEDPVAALEALATMVFNPIDTGYYLGKMIFSSFNRDVIHGDAESRAHWFVYASSTILGPKVVKQIGKKVDSKAKEGAQKAEQRFDDLLPYHSKHQVALVGSVPYNVFNGGFFVERLVMMAERLPGSLGGLSAGGRKIGKSTGKYNSGTIKHIYHGEINRRGKAVGYHHESMMGGKIVPGTKKTPDKNGVYEAKIEIDGKKKIAKSSFFPKEWNRVDVLKAIDEAFHNKKQIGPNKYIGGTSSGIKIEMFLNKNGSIATAYPLYNK